MIGRRRVDGSPARTDAVNPMDHISEEREMRPMLRIMAEMPF